MANTCRDFNRNIMGRRMQQRRDHNENQAYHESTLRHDRAGSNEN